MLTGGGGEDQLFGDNAGAGTASGLVGGRDWLDGGAGPDVLRAGPGDDRLRGGADAPDLCDGEAGTDTAGSSCESASVP